MGAAVTGYRLGCGVGDLEGSCIGCIDVGFVDGAFVVGLLLGFLLGDLKGDWLGDAVEGGALGSEVGAVVVVVILVVVVVVVVVATGALVLPPVPMGLFDGLEDSSPTRVGFGVETTVGAVDVGLLDGLLDDGMPVGL